MNLANNMYQILCKMAAMLLCC